MKYATLHFNAAEIRQKVAQLRRMYAQNTTPGEANFYVVWKWSGFFIGFAKIMCVLVTYVAVFIIMRPLVVYWLSNELIMMVPIWLPGVDETTTLGYIITFAFHLCDALLSAVGSVGADVLFIAFVLHLWPMCEIFDRTFQMINDAAQFRTFRSSAELRRFVRNAAQMHKEMCDFKLWVSNAYSMQCWVEVNSNGTSLCMCVFCILTVSVSNVSFLI